jgi:site-specific DNA-adenine methylase
VAKSADLRPFFGYYGGKWRDARKHYPAPTHPQIFEPFAGSAGYALRHAHLRVTLYDLDPVICGVWDYLTKVRPEEVLAIPDVHADETVADLLVPQEARWLVGFWMNRAVSAPRNKPSKWMREGARPGSFWGPRVRQNIASQVDAIRHWRVVNASYENVDTSAPATWFVDPPYQSAGKHYRFGSVGIDYAHLSAWCRNLQGQVIVCEAGDADWLDFAKLADIKTTRPGKRSVEAVWLR